MYNNYPYGIFNADYLRAYQTRQMEEQRNWEQNKNVFDLTKALSDFLDAAGKIDPDYRQMAFDACASVILSRMAKNNGGIQ